MKKITIALLFVFAVLFVLSFPYKSTIKRSGNISPNILYLTRPVTSFSGKVEKITGNVITVSKKLTAPQNPPTDRISPLPTPETVVITYLITITDDTQIGRQTLPHIAAPHSDLKLTVRDIKIGQSVTVGNIYDLRTMTGNALEASAVTLPPIPDTLSGLIVGLEGSVLTVKGTPVTPPSLPSFEIDPPEAPREIDYRIAVTAETEIISITPPAGPGEMPENKKISLSDLKKDMLVTVFTGQDVGEKSRLTALRISTTVQ